MNLEGYLVSLLVKLAVMASIASIAGAISTVPVDVDARKPHFDRSGWHLPFGLLCVFAVERGGARCGSHQTAYEAADLGLEGSLIAGILGGYVTGLLSGILISLPTFCSPGDILRCPCWPASAFWAACCAIWRPTPEEVWRFSPFPTSTFTASSKRSTTTGAPGFQSDFFRGDSVRRSLPPRSRQSLFATGAICSFSSRRRRNRPGHSLAIAAIYATTLFAVAIPL